MLGKALWWLALVVVFAIVPKKEASAAPLTFDYKDPKGISAVSLALDSPLEPIFGYAKGLSGTIHFDPANPKATTGKIAVDVSSVQFANEGYTATARGFALEGEKYPQVFFTLKRVVRGTRPAPNVFKGTVEADFTCKGITLPLTVPVTAHYFPGRAAERTNGQFEGDLLVVRTQFAVSRTKLGISRGIPAAMVGDSVEVRVSCVGIHYATPKPPPPTSKTAKGNVWKMEVELRDDPLLVDAAFDRDPKVPRATFTTAIGTVTAENVRLVGDKMTFRLAKNAVTGGEPFTGTAIFGNATLRGTLVGETETLRFHGRPRKPATKPAKAIDKTGPGPGFRNVTIDADSKTWTLAERMDFHRVPAVSIARIENFAVAEVGAFGVADVETGAPVDVDTRFQAGGMGSPLVNLLALKLAGLGKIDLTRSVNAYLKRAKIPDNALTRRRPVRVLDLVNGTSGLTQYKFTGYPPGVKPPSLVALLNGADPREMEPLAVTTEPGATFKGGGINQAILEQVLADATGTPFPDLMREQIFVPFGMTRSTYEPLPSGAALGHYSTGERMLDRVHVYPAQGETGLWTTAGDFARALCQVQRLLAGKSNAILPESRRDLLASVRGEKWVLGLIEEENGTGYAYHGGDPYGFYANHRTHLKNGDGVVVMQNRIMSWRLSNELIAAVAKQHDRTVQRTGGDR